jgi:hypothetical protein
VCNAGSKPLKREGGKANSRYAIRQSESAMAMIPEFNTARGANPREHFHYRGKYVIRVERRGPSFLYSVLTKGGLLVSAGLDMLSLDEKTALEGIVGRLCERSK